MSQTTLDRPLRRRSRAQVGLQLRRRPQRGRGRHAQPARRQGRQPRRDGQHRPARAARLHHHHRGLHRLLRQRPALPRRTRKPRCAALDTHRGGHRRPASFGDPRPAAAGLGPLRRPRVDAGHDGHRAQPRPQRRHRGRAWPPPRATARFAWDSYRRFIQMYGSVVLGVDHHRFEDIIETAKLDRGVVEDTALSSRRTGRRGRRLQGRWCWPRPASPFPMDPRGAALGRHRGRVRQLDEPARQHLPPPARHPRRTGAPRSTCRPWCSATWEATAPPGSASPATPPPARTSSTASSWSTRRARTWSPASARRSRCRACAPSPARSPWSRPAQRLRRPRRGPRDAGAALQRHAGHRVHRAAEQAVHAADAQRQAHRAAEPAHRRRDGAGGPDRPATEAVQAASTPQALDQLLHPTTGPQGAAHPVLQGPAREPRGGIRHRCRVQRRRGGDARRQRARASCWCVSRPARRTSTACTRRAAS